ncbi:MAG: GTP cyclohydrolase II [Betaproteobacteria bacterium]|nr:GTP cyclohydrolase II [Betaproteobacteria bacterium]MDE2423744.1 GTP cyclohydrolase II [Betaproteobacteria bacterium]
MKYEEHTLSPPWVHLPTRYGKFRARSYDFNDQEHLVLTLGEVTQGPVLVRIHSECLTGDVFHSLRCDCGQQLEFAMERIVALNKGVIIYLRGHEGRGIGLKQKLAAYSLQDQGMDTVDANLSLGLPVDARSYDAAVAILHDLQVKEIDLLTNNPEKLARLEASSLVIRNRIAVQTTIHPITQKYLQTKRDRMGHLLEIDADESKAK